MGIIEVNLIHYTTEMTKMSMAVLIFINLWYNMAT